MSFNSAPPPHGYDHPWMYKFWSEVRSLLASASALLDTITSTRGSILYRGASAWLGLAPGTSGQFLKTNGSGADPSWASIATVTSITSTLTIDSGTASVIVGNFSSSTGGNLVLNGEFGIL